MKKDYFDSIDNLPIWNWWQIIETGNLVYLLKDSDYTELSFDNSEVWYKIQDEYLAKFGFNRELEELIRLKKEWIEKQAKYIIEGDRFARMEAEIIEEDIRMQSDTKGYMGKDDTLIFLEEKLGREIDPKAISVRKYNNYIKYYSKK